MKLARFAVGLLGLLQIAHGQLRSSLATKIVNAERRLDDTSPLDIVFVLDEFQAMELFLSKIYEEIPKIIMQARIMSNDNCRFGVVGVGIGDTSRERDRPPEGSPDRELAREGEPFGKPEVLVPMTPISGSGEALREAIDAFIGAIRDNIILNDFGPEVTPGLTALEYIADGTMDNDPGLAAGAALGLGASADKNPGPCLVYFGIKESDDDSVFSAVEDPCYEARKLAQMNPQELHSELIKAGVLVPYSNQTAEELRQASERILGRMDCFDPCVRFLEFTEEELQEYPHVVRDLSPACVANPCFERRYTKEELDENPDLVRDLGGGCCRRRHLEMNPQELYEEHQQVAGGDTAGHRELCDPCRRFLEYSEEELRRYPFAAQELRELCGTCPVRYLEMNPQELYEEHQKVTSGPNARRQLIPVCGGPCVRFLSYSRKELEDYPLEESYFDDICLPYCEYRNLMTMTVTEIRETFESQEIMAGHVDQHAKENNQETRRLFDPEYIIDFFLDGACYRVCDRFLEATPEELQSMPEDTRELFMQVCAEPDCEYRKARVLAMNPQELHAEFMKKGFGELKAAKSGKDFHEAARELLYDSSLFCGNPCEYRYLTYTPEELAEFPEAARELQFFCLSRTCEERSRSLSTPQELLDDIVELGLVDAAHTPEELLQRKLGEISVSPEDMLCYDICERFLEYTPDQMEKYPDASRKLTSLCVDPCYGGEVGYGGEVLGDGDELRFLAHNPQELVDELEEKGLFGKEISLTESGKMRKLYDPFDFLELSYMSFTAGLCANPCERFLSYTPEELDQFPMAARKLGLVCFDECGLGVGARDLLSLNPEEFYNEIEDFAQQKGLEIEYGNRELYDSIFLNFCINPCERALMYTPEEFEQYPEAARKLGIMCVPGCSVRSLSPAELNEQVEIREKIGGNFGLERKLLIGPNNSGMDPFMGVCVDYCERLLEFTASELKQYPEETRKLGNICGLDNDCEYRMLMMTPQELNQDAQAYASEKLKSVAAEIDFGDRKLGNILEDISEIFFANFWDGYCYFNPCRRFLKYSQEELDEFPEDARDLEGLCFDFCIDPPRFLSMNPQELYDELESTGLVEVTPTQRSDEIGGSRELYDVYGYYEYVTIFSTLMATSSWSRLFDYMCWDPCDRFLSYTEDELSEFPDAARKLGSVCLDPCIYGPSRRLVSRNPQELHRRLDAYGVFGRRDKVYGDYFSSRLRELRDFGGLNDISQAIGVLFCSNPCNEFASFGARELAEFPEEARELGSICIDNCEYRRSLWMSPNELSQEMDKYGFKDALSDEQRELLGSPDMVIDILDDLITAVGDLFCFDPCRRFMAFTEAEKEEIDLDNKRLLEAICVNPCGNFPPQDYYRGLSPSQLYERLDEVGFKKAVEDFTEGIDHGRKTLDPSTDFSAFFNQLFYDYCEPCTTYGGYEDPPFVLRQLLDFSCGCLPPGRRLGMNPQELLDDLTSIGWTADASKKLPRGAPTRRLSYIEESGIELEFPQYGFACRTYGEPACQCNPCVYSYSNYNRRELEEFPEAARKLSEICLHPCDFDPISCASDLESDAEDAFVAMSTVHATFVGVVLEANIIADYQYSYLADLTEGTIMDLGPLREGAGDASDVAAITNTITDTCVAAWGGPRLMPSDMPSGAPSTTPPGGTSSGGGGGAGDADADSAQPSDTPSGSPTFTDSPSLSPSGMPSSAPSESLAPSSMPSSQPSVACDDQQEVLFDVVNSNYQKDCAWFVDRVNSPIVRVREFGNEIDAGSFTSDELYEFAGYNVTRLEDFASMTWGQVLCGYNILGNKRAATDVCEESCGTCSDDCFDDDNTPFIPEGETTPQRCPWLRARTRLWSRNCYTPNDPGEQNGPAAGICRDTCESCSRA